MTDEDVSVEVTVPPPEIETPVINPAPLPDDFKERIGREITELQVKVDQLSEQVVTVASTAEVAEIIAEQAQDVAIAAEAEVEHTEDVIEAVKEEVEAEVEKVEEDSGKTEPEVSEEDIEPNRVHPFHRKLW